MVASLRWRRCMVIALSAMIASVAWICMARRPASMAQRSAGGEDIPRAQIDSVRERVQTALELIRLLRPSMLVSREARAAPELRR